MGVSLAQLSAKKRARKSNAEPLTNKWIISLSFFFFDNAFALFHFSTSPIFLRIFLGCEIQILAEWNFHVKSDLASTPLAMLNFRDAAKVKYKPKKKKHKKNIKKKAAENFKTKNADKKK